MNRASIKNVLVVGVAIFAFGLCALPADAGWWHGCSYCGGWYGGCCGSYYGGCDCYSGCRHHGCYGWGGCGYGCGCDCGLSCWSSCCGTSVTYSGCGCGTWGTPSTPPAAPATPTPGAATPSSSSIQSPDAESAMLTVLVPSEAKVTINGMLTKSTGSQRRYVSYGLRPGQAYQFKVKAEIVREGKIVADEQTVSLTAGAERGIAFGFIAPSSERLARTE